ncbi:MAG: LemA family protein [Candidatus Gracilibacteria bacterium]|nr:LemA family protein [Candidatus Gracilibacteria bacterium]
MTPTIVILIIISVIVIFIIAKYNGIIQMRNNRQNAFADIDVQLKQRFDLVPNLVNTVKGYASHEQVIFDKILDARKAYAGAGSIDAKIAANNDMTGALGRLFAIAESNPEIKANENFMQLQSELSDIENKLAAARRFFNSSTNEYNTYIQVFPTNIMANMFNFKSEIFFEVENREEAEKAPNVTF